MAHKNRIQFVSLLALGVAMPAFAQEGPQTDPQADTGRDVVVITANKREETLQDVAVAVTAVTSQDKQELGIITVTDLTNVTPGLSYTPGNERVTLRGIGRLTNSFGADPGVANYNDGLYTPFAVMAGKDASFIQRVEVLRGPQGTLYGRNAIGGAINTISKRPTDEFSTDFKLGVGNYGYTNVVAAVSGPITDDVRYRVSGQREQRDGIDYNYGTGKKQGWEIDDYYLEAQLEGDIGDRFSWWLKVADAGYDKAGPPGGTTATFSNAPYLSTFAPSGSVGPNPAFAYTNPSVTSFSQTGTRTDNPFATNGEHAYNTNYAATAKLDQYDEAIAEAVYSTDWFDIKYVGGYTFYDYKLTSDGDGTAIDSVTYNSIATVNPSPLCTGGNGSLPNVVGFPTSTFPPTVPAGFCYTATPKTIFPNVLNLYAESRSLFSNEINLISTVEGPLQWIVGAYQYQENSKQPGQVQTLDNEPLADAYFNPTTLTFIQNPNRYLQYFSNTSLFNAYGLYGQADYTLNDQLKFTVGLRYSKDLKQSKEEAFLACYILCTTVDGNPDPNATFFLPQYVNISASQYGAAIAASPGAVIDSRGFAVRTLKDDWEAVTGTAGVEYRPWDDSLMFAKYSRGYKAGGFNNLGFSASPYTESEFVDSYEAGWKQTWDGLNLTTNASVFLYNYSDAQAPLSVVTTVGGLQSASTQFVNLPEVETTGFELEGNWRPVDDLNIGFTYAYLNAEITESDVYLDPSRDSRCHSTNAPAVSATCVATAGPAFANIQNDTTARRSVEGNTLSQTPKNKVAINASYRFNMEDGSYFLPTVSYSWRDKFYDSFFNNDNELSPSYSNVDARLNWKSADEVLGVTLWVRNLTDETQNTSVSANGFRNEDNGRYQTFSYTPPRMFGVDLLVHY